MKKTLTLFYGIFAYIYGMSILSWSILFVGGWLIPTTIDNSNGLEGVKGWIINGLLLALFATQHTIMARPAFKRWATKFIPEPAERSTFVLTTAVVLHLLLTFWSSYPSIIWDFSGTPLGTFLMTLSIVGFAFGVLASSQIDHFELFGLKQVYKNWKGESFQEPPFVTPILYQFVRNPLMLGFLIGFWAAPKMTQGHIFFNIMVTSYMFFGIFMEERDLAKKLGPDYQEYKRKTPMLIPFLKFSN